MNISGAQRLSNGNTLICEGTSGRFFEVDVTGNTVWKYVNPVIPSGAVSQGTTVTMNSVFRCTQYAATYAGLSGKVLTAGLPIEQNPLSYNCSMVTGVPSVTTSGHFAVLVNPFNEEIQLRNVDCSGAVDISLCNSTGVVCKKWTGKQLTANASLSLELAEDLPKGLYLLYVRSAGYSQVIKLSH
jgi:hypothetical protein